MQEIQVNPFCRLKFSYDGISPESTSIIPRLRINLNVSCISSDQPTIPVNLTFYRSQFSIGNKDRLLYAGVIMAEYPMYTFTSGSSQSVAFYADLDHYKLTQMEKLRSGKDLRLVISTNFVADWWQQPAQQTNKISKETHLDERIPKSDWVENILPQLGFKEVALIEIPKLENPDFADAITKINEAWKQYSMGEYDKVLTECRKALEALVTITKAKGFHKESTDETGNKRTVPDWKKALAHDSIGDIMDVLVQKDFGFLAPGSHYGKSMSRQDAELAIMLTHGLTSFVSKSLAT